MNRTEQKLIELGYRMLGETEVPMAPLYEVIVFGHRRGIWFKPKVAAVVSGTPEKP
jgi:hypothetical protein